MISRALLKDFGRFKDAVFDFSPVTVFVGGNESGKTTLFDALFDGICRPRGNTVHGKRLAARYGTRRESTLEFDGPEISIDPEEFLNLNAVGAGNAAVEFSGGGWVERVKASIFTGGIDIGRLAGEFEVLARDKGMLTHVLRYRKKKEEHGRLENRLEELKERKTAILEKESALRELRRELAALASRGRGIGERISRTERRLEQQAKIRTREELIRTLALISETRALEAALARLEAVKEDRSGDLKRLSAGIVKLEARSAALAREALGAAERLEAAEKRVAGKTRDAAALGSAAGAADRLVSRIESETPRTVVRTVTVWNRALLALSFVPAAAGVALAVLLPPAVPAAVVVAGSAAVTCLMVFFARKTEERHEAPDTSGFIGRLKDDWRTRSGGGELKSSTVEGLHSELLAVRSEYDAAERELARLREERDTLKSEAGRAAADKALGESELSAARSLLQKTLQPLGVGSVEEYTARRSEYEHLGKDHRRKLSELEAERNRFHAADVNGLKAECEARAAGLSAEITDEKETEAGMNLLRGELAALREEKAAASSREASVRSLVDKGEGEVKGSLGNLPEEIYDAEQALRRCGRELFEMEVDRKAAATVRDILEDMSRDTDDVFIELSGDIARYFEGMLPGGRHVSVGSFKAGDIEVSDAGGGRRPIEHLSTGTRDAFHLAARLALTLRSHKPGAPGLIVLDEPFHSLDRPRSLRALEVLRAFHDAHGWQIALFSKEEYLAGEMERLFAKLRVHRLTAATKCAA